MSALLRFDDVALRRGGRLLFEDLDLELGPGERAAGGRAQRQRQVEPDPARRRAAPRRARPSRALDRSRSPTTISRSTASCRWPRASFWGGAVDAAMEALGLAHLAGVPVRLLSSGQLKRATLARVAASGAPLWLLDEPLNALDADGGERLGAVDRRASRGGRRGRSPRRTSRSPATGAGWSSAR